MMMTRVMQVIMQVNHLPKDTIKPDQNQPALDDDNKLLKRWVQQVLKNYTLFIFFLKGSLGCVVYQDLGHGKSKQKTDNFTCSNTDGS